MALVRGQRLGPYEILEPIGAGGMGEVYRAKDSRLDREVAIKVLPAAGAGNAEALARFQRESRAIASLSHPNLLAVYDVGTVSDITFTVTELLSGETLRTRLLRERIDTRSCVQIVRAVALGLAAAHERGLVHRDIKPENIFLTRAGEVKVLDFGLVKAAAPRDEARQRDTETHSVLTDPGWLMGTPGYMAPEQIQGVPVDHRADLFAVGAVLYEMLSGERAFKGPTTAETIAATLRDAPPPILSSDPRRTMLARIVERCLEKQPSMRFQNAHDLAFALETAMGEVQTPSGTPSPPLSVATRLAHAPALRWIALGLIGIMGAWIGSAVSREKPAHAPPPERVSIGLGRIFGARFAPDGKGLFYAASLGGRDPDIYEVRPDSRDRRSLGLAPATLFAVSSRNEIAVNQKPSFPLTYYQPGTLAVAPPSGVAVRSLLPMVNAADWTADGKELIVARRNGAKTILEWPIGHPILETDGTIGSLRLSPQGDRAAFFYYRDAVSLETITRAGVRRVEARGLTVTSGGLAFHPSGELWFTGERAEGPIALRALDPRGAERVVARDTRGLVLQDIAADGRVLLKTNSFRAEVHLEWEQSSEDVSIDIDSTLEDMAEDGTLLINDRRDLFVRSAAGAVTRVFDSAQRFRSRLSPDGRWLATVPLAVGEARPAKIVLAPVGPGESQVEELGGLSLVGSPSWFPDDSAVLITTASSWTGGPYALQRVRRGSRGLEKLLDLKAAGGSVLVSPDGRTASVALPDPTPDSSLFLLLDLKSGSTREVRTTARVGYQIAWTSDGRSLYAYIQGEMPAVIRRVDVGSGRVTVDRTIHLADPAGAWRVHPIRINRTGRLVSYTVSRDLSDLYVYSGLK